MKLSKKDRILLFDLGNILVSLNSVRGLWTGLPAGSTAGTTALDQLWSHSKAVIDYESGRIDSLQEFYAAIKKEMPITVPEDEFNFIFNQAIGDVFPETRQLLTLLSRRYRLFLLSNTSQAHWAICRDTHHLDVFFVKTFLSYEMGCMKPDPAAFQITIQEIGVNPDNIWYYDDRAENVIEAIKHGINAHISFGGNTLINDLRKHGFVDENSFSS